MHKQKRFLFSILLIISLFLNGCKSNDFIEIKNTTQISFLKIKYDNNHTTKNFSTLSSENTQKRLDLFSEYGELECIKIYISGIVNISKNYNNLTPKDLEGNTIPTDTLSTAISHYSDSFQINIKLPNSTTRVSLKDDLFENSLSYNLLNYKEKYFKLNIEYLRANVDKSIWKLNCNSDTNDCFIYIKFLNKENKKLKECFLNLIYNIKLI